MPAAFNGVTARVSRFAGAPVAGAHPALVVVALYPDVTPGVAHATAYFVGPTARRDDVSFSDQQVALDLGVVAGVAVIDAQARAVRQEQVFPLVAAFDRPAAIAGQPRLDSDRGNLARIARIALLPQHVTQGGIYLVAYFHSDCLVLSHFAFSDASSLIVRPPSP